jgi:superfamily II DNA/RNA helicase
MMKELASAEIMFADDKTRADESAKFLRHLTYNHTEVVKAIMNDMPKQKRKQEYDWFK